MRDDDLCYMSAEEAILRFKNLSLSPVELLDAIIARASSISDTVNPFEIVILMKRETRRRSRKHYMLTKIRKQALSKASLLQSRIFVRLRKTYHCWLSNQ